jgi:tetratricopeptide (TPR) repeat protein
MTLGRKNEAIEVIATARSLDPDDEGMIVSLAILLSDQGRFKDALSLLEEANRRFPDRRPTATTLARLLASAPDASLRDGARALAIAKAIYDDEPSPAYAETVALALAELGRCVEAREWIRRAVTEAQQGRDRAEAARLEGEVPRYQSTPCRP